MLKSGVAAQTLASSPQVAPSIASSSGSLSSSGLAETPSDLQVGTLNARVAVAPPAGHRGAKVAQAGADPASALRWKVCHRQYGDVHGCPVIELKALLNYMGRRSQATTPPDLKPSKRHVTTCHDILRHVTTPHDMSRQSATIYDTGKRSVSDPVINLAMTTLFHLLTD
eukprot:194642-Amphidinium_carterae.1